MGLRSRIALLLAQAPAGAPAIEVDGTWSTWGALQDVAQQLDALLQERGLGRGARVGVVLQSTPAHVAVALSLIGTGRTLVTISPLQPPDRMAEDIGRAKVDALVAADSVYATTTIGVGTVGVRVELRGGDLVAIDAVSKLTASGGSEVLIEMLTSGTTGTPKRVLLTEAQLDGALSASGQQATDDKLLSAAVSLVATPLVHIGGLWPLLTGIQAGRRIALAARFTPDGWVDAVQRHQIKAAGLVPAALRSVLELAPDPSALESLQVVLCGTAACPPEIADEFYKRYDARVLMTYGATEFAGAVAGWTKPLHEKWWETKKGSVGRAFPQVRLQVVDPDGLVLPTGGEGLIEISSPQSGDEGDQWARTSDVGRLDEDGFLWITGRADDVIIRGGFKIQPAAVRSALESHPAVREAAVTGLDDERLGQVPVAAVELTAGAGAPSEEELREHCRRSLTPYEVPTRVLVVSALPRTAALKVSKVDLLELFHQDA